MYCRKHVLCTTWFLNCPLAAMNQSPVHQNYNYSAWDPSAWVLRKKHSHKRRDIIVVVVVVIVTVDVVVVSVNDQRRRVAVIVAIFRNDGRSPQMMPFPAIHNSFHGPRHLLWSRPRLAKQLLPSHYRLFGNWGHCKEKFFLFSRKVLSLKWHFFVFVGLFGCQESERK